MTFHPPSLGGLLVCVVSAHRLVSVQLWWSRTFSELRCRVRSHRPIYLSPSSSARTQRLHHVRHRHDVGCGGLHVESVDPMRTVQYY